jgi:hypothetical protein
MKTFLYFIILLVVVPFSARSGELKITGVYLGKNIYIQNPLSNDRVSFCSEEVYLNGNKIFIDVERSAFEIDLSSVGLNKSVFIKIVHKDSCSPKVINPEAIKPIMAKKFRFQNVLITNSQLSFSTSDEMPLSLFSIEKSLEGDWIRIDTLNAKGSRDINQYSIAINHEEGNNRYRIQYIPFEGKAHLSEEIEFDFTGDPVAYDVSKHKDKIVLSKPAAYEIMDENGNKVKSGKTEEILLSDLRPGIYYINVGNKTEKIIRK